MNKRIGNCDTCDYILKCTRSGLAKKIFGGCPKSIVEEYEKSNPRENGTFAENGEIGQNPRADRDKTK